MSDLMVEGVLGSPFSFAGHKVESQLGLSDGLLNYLIVVALKGLSGSRLSYGSSGRPLTKALIEKEASFTEKAKFHSLVFAISVEARLHSLLCGKSLW
ncbi:unnamed protein product [Arabidopsis lyrata]|nr:unnamed protein product [Arabidopsis lyrata]